MTTTGYATCQVADYLHELQRDGDLLAIAADRAGLGAAVPACPGWQVRDLLRHVGYVHRWAAGYVRDQCAQMRGRSSEAEILADGPPDESLGGWYRDGHADLVRVLASAGPGTDCWAFLEAPSPLAFWARRQAHETAIHRIDAELAAAGTGAGSAGKDGAGAGEPGAEGPPFPAAFAADGIDELIMGFGRRRRYQPGAVGGGLLRVIAADTGDAWCIEAHEGRLQPRRDTGDDATDGAACTVRGPASGVYLYLWNRADAESAGVTVAGHPAVLASWKSSVRVRWS